jgi:ribulose-phosphate 3-epimerase
MFHVDVLDGSLFNATCWADANVIGSWGQLPDIELHCMVQDPVAVAEAWHHHVPSLKRVIVHFEIGRPLTNAVTRLRALGVEVVLAINPTTLVDDIAGSPIDALMVMGVEPGKSGQAFLGEPILAKLRRAKSLFPNLLIEVDGGVSSTNIGALMHIGVSRCVASSALWKAENPAEAYEELLSKTR